MFAPPFQVSSNGIDEGSIGDDLGGQVSGFSPGFLPPVLLTIRMSDPTSPGPATESPEAEILALLNKRLIVLVGMMGAGKSTIERRLAARLNLPLVDPYIEI